MFTQKDDVVRQRKASDLGKITIDKGIFGLSSYEDMDNFFEESNKNLKGKVAFTGRNFYNHNTSQDSIDKVVRPKARSLDKRHDEDVKSIEKKKISNKYDLHSFVIAEELVLDIIQDETLFKKMPEKERSYNIIKELRQICQKGIKEIISLVRKNNEERRKEDVEFMEEHKKWLDLKGDIFEWLKVSTQFKHLKKNLREKLIEVIGVKKNRERIENQQSMITEKINSDPDFCILDHRINLGKL